MKILVIADPMIPVPPILYGGIERIIDMLIKGLVLNGHEVALCAHKESTVNCKLYSYPNESASSFSSFIQNIQIINRSRIEKPDIVHSFGRIAYLSPYLFSNLPKIMSYQREPTLSRIKWGMYAAPKGSLVFTGCSEYIAKQIRPYAPSYAIHNGVPMNLYDFKSDIDVHAPLVFLGRIEYIKGAHLAIEAAIKSNKKLIIAGNVPSDNESQTYFNQQIQPFLDGSQIQYIGPVNDTQKNELLGKAAAFLMPILWDEPFGIVMAEALACGTPIIALNRGSVPEIVEHGINGFICNDMNEIINSIKQISTINRSTCRDIALQRFSENHIVNEYQKLYCNLINGI